MCECRWADIESAPRDGSQFIATDETHVEVCAWHDGVPEQLECGVVTDPGMDAGFWGGEHIYPGGSIPTRWMPFPPPPSGDAGNGSG